MTNRLLDGGSPSRESSRKLFARRYGIGVHISGTVQSSGEPIRVLFAFDPDRQGVILCGGHKGNEKRFYKEMIALAEAEYDNHMKGNKS